MRRPTTTDFDILAYDINGLLVLDIDVTTLMTPHVSPLPARFSVSALCLVDLDVDPELEVVALIDNEATLKRFFREGDHIRLQPENSALEPIIIAADTREVAIIGKVTGLCRALP